MEQTGTLSLYAPIGFFGFYEANEDRGTRTDFKTISQWATHSLSQNSQITHRLLRTGFLGLLPLHLLWLIAHADNKEAGTPSLPAPTEY